MEGSARRAAGSLRNHPRIAVVGTSCSGKTTLSRQLAALLGRPHVELDALHWGPNWSKRADFEDRVREASSADGWVVDGNYSAVRQHVWGRATALVWLRYPFHVVFGRALRRTARRLVTQEPMYGDNRESLRQALAWNGIPCWVVRTWRRHRREYPRLLAEPCFAHLAVLELRSDADACGLLRAVESGDPGAAQRGDREHARGSA